MTDGELVRQTLGGRRQAYDELVRRWSARVLAVCHARVRRSDVAEELAQESLVRGFKSLSTLGEAEKFGSWLCGIATRVCFDWLKDKDRTQVTFASMGDGMRPEILADGHAGAAEGLESDEEVRDLMAEVQRLPDKHREVVMLYYYQDSTYQELAQLLGVSAATINARLTEARKMLRDRMMRKEGSSR